VKRRPYLPLPPGDGRGEGRPPTLTLPSPGGRGFLAGLMPHAGRMMLLDELLHWDESSVTCAARSHLDPAHPLRARSRLAAVCGVEYGLQAAALHGALCSGGVPQPAGYAATLRAVTLEVDRLDAPSFGELIIHARVEAKEQFGMVYAFTVGTDAGAPLVSGRASIALPR
jgi:predicted hotdog family 3-hydroxylacyl-ACP dehydratase